MPTKIKKILLSPVLFFIMNQGFAQETKDVWVVKSDTENKVHKVVVQLNTADTASWSGVIGNIKNMQKVWPKNLYVEVVVHGKAIEFLVKDKTFFTKDIQLLATQGIKFSACQNTMRKHNITEDMLIKEAGTVPSGVVEVILKQEEGWSYIKSGL
jgi:intracellular sulfur oxidation DsrE/DsrF family protein